MYHDEPGRHLFEGVQDTDILADLHRAMQGAPRPFFARPLAMAGYQDSLELMASMIEDGSVVPHFHHFGDPVIPFIRAAF